MMSDYFICTICKSRYIPQFKLNGTLFRSCKKCRERGRIYDRKKKDKILSELLTEKLKNFDDYNDVQNCDL